MHAPAHGAYSPAPLIVDLEATLVGPHSNLAAPNDKKGFGFHPVWSFVYDGAEGKVEPLSVLLRPGNAGSNTARHRIAGHQGPPGPAAEGIGVRTPRLGFP